MVMGSMPRDGGNLIFKDRNDLKIDDEWSIVEDWIRSYVGSDEIVSGSRRYCLWICEDDYKIAREIPSLDVRFQNVRKMRLESTLESTVEFADRPYRFVYLAGEAESHTIAVSGVSSENRRFLPANMYGRDTVVSNAAFALYDAPIWNLSIIVSSLHTVWIAAICGKLETRYRYSNTLGWNTFPVPTLTDQNKADLTRCAEDILLAREAHFPATIADLYDPEAMPEDLRAAHDRNDEVLERIYIGRRFRNDTERLEKLFEMYTRMTKGKAA
jgi:hypothetical protein